MVTLAFTTLHHTWATLQRSTPWFLLSPHLCNYWCNPDCTFCVSSWVICRSILCHTRIWDKLLKSFHLNGKETACLLPIPNNTICKVRQLYQWPLGICKLPRLRSNYCSKVHPNNSYIPHQQWQTKSPVLCRFKCDLIISEETPYQ